MTLPAPEELVRAARALAADAGRLRFGPPVTHVYNPLEYAWAGHKVYLERYAHAPAEIVFLGMNPGPFGMAQTGVPFGEIAAVRDWLKIEAKIERPSPEHPRRPILGFKCHRSEVSGRRLWGLFAARFKTPEAFFARHFVVNYCPLVFMLETGANHPPDKLPAAESAALERVCDAHLRRVVEILQPKWLIGVGAFAEKRAQRAAAGLNIKTGSILHPSPASPKANRDWPGQAAAQLKVLGVWPSPPP